MAVFQEFYQEYPVAILISSRHAGSAEFLPDELIDHSVVLEPLSTQALTTLAEIQLGGVPSRDLVQMLEVRSEGNPYFADQFLVFLQEATLSLVQRCTTRTCSSSNTQTRWLRIVPSPAPNDGSFFLRWIRAWLHRSKAVCRSSSRSRFNRLRSKVAAS